MLQGDPFADQWDEIRTIMTRDDVRATPNIARTFWWETGHIRKWVSYDYEGQRWRHPQAQYANITPTHTHISTYTHTYHPHTYRMAHLKAFSPRLRAAPERGACGRRVRRLLLQVRVSCVQQHTKVGAGASRMREEVAGGAGSGGIVAGFTNESSKLLLAADALRSQT
jgi:hypothetical protein